MKAKDLAALLMQNPEMEVYHENWHSDDMCEVYYSPEIIDGIEITPSGVFIKTASVDFNDSREIKLPSNKPIIGTIDLVFHQERQIDTEDADGEPVVDVTNVVFPFYNSDSQPMHGNDFFRELLEDGEVYGCDGNVFALDENYEPDHNTWQFYTPEDVMEVKVLTSFDEQWNVQYTSMKFEEAKKYFETK